MLGCKVCQNKTTIKYRGIYDKRHGYPSKFDIYKCPNCGFMQTKPQLSSHQLAQVYTNYYPKRDANVNKIVTSSRKIPSKVEITQNGLGTTCHFQTKKGQKVLDIGSGTCQSLLEIKKLGGEAWGLDPDKNSQNVAKKLRLKFHLGTIHDCVFPKNYFDLITASQVLEHEKDPLMFLNDCKKFLKNDGKIILSCPNTGALYKKVWGKYWLHWHIPYHLNHFNKKSIEILTKKAGLKIISIKTTTPNLWTILQIRSVINNPKQGSRDPIWDPETILENEKQKPNLLNSALTKVLPVVQSMLFVNRIIDYFRLGESFVIELKRDSC